MWCGKIMLCCTRLVKKSGDLPGGKSVSGCYEDICLNV